MLDLIFRKPLGFFLLVILLAGTGGYLVTQLPVLMYPQTQRPRVDVNVSHPGISATDFAAVYAGTIETSLLALEDMDLMETTYSTDSSRFSLTFNWNIESEDARNEVTDLMDSLNSRLPSEIQDAWSVRYREGENAGYLVMGLTSPSTDRDTLYRLLRDNVEPRLSGVQDVDELGIYNTRRLLADVTLNQDRMLSYGLTIADVERALGSGFDPRPLGTLNTGDGRLSIRLSKKSNTLNDLADLEIATVGDTTISLDDIATLDIRYTLPRQLFLVGNAPAVQLTATPVEGGNITAMTAEITARIDEAIATGLVPADTAYDLYLDPAKYINRSIDNVVQAALLGGALAVLVVFLILGEFKHTLIIALSLPMSIVLSFILMYVFGVTLNLISLGGLALAVGMIVDSTIVVMENIHRFREESGREPEGDEWKEMVKAATAQVRGPVIASTLTSVLVFFPISYTAPLTDAILGDQARTVVFSLLCSLVVSLTVVPLIAYQLFKGHRKTVVHRLDPRHMSGKAVARVTRIYKGMLRRLTASTARVVTFLLATVGLLAALLVFVLPLIPKEIISTPTSDRVVIFFRNSSINDQEVLMDQYLPELDRIIGEALGDMVVAKYTSLSGFFNQTFIDLRSSKDSPEAIARLQKVLVSEGDWYYNILAWDPAELPLPRTLDFQLSIRGPDEAVKVGLLSEIQTILNNAALFNWVATQPSSTIVRQLNMEPREETIGAFSSLSESSLTSLVRLTLAGTSSIELSNGEDDVEVTAEFPSTDFDSQEKLENYLIPWNRNFVPLRHFFTFTVEEGVSQIFAENGETVFRVNGIAGMRISDGDRLALQARAKEILDAELVVPEGYSFTIATPNAELQEAISTLFIALGASVVLIYLLLAFQFNSLWIPLVVLTTIPLGFIGVILALWVFNSALNLNSLLGTILLGGIVVNNAIIMIDFFLQARKEYSSLREAVIETAGIRFQPILITTLTTIIGMLPLALGMGEGSNILQPLGIAVSGGLLISTVFTLFAVPSILYLSTRVGHGPTTHITASQETAQ